MKLLRPLVVLDLETTGLWIEKDKIIEIGMVKVNPDNTQETFVQRVNPGIPIPDEVKTLTGISNDDVRNAPVFKDIVSKVLQFIGGSDIGGFNVEKYDIPLLRREVHEAGLELDMSVRTIVDSQTVYIINEKRNLASAYKFYCGKDIQNAHTALADAAATLEILLQQIKNYGNGDESIGSLAKFVFKKSEDFVDPERKLRLWNGDYFLTFGKYRNQSLKEVMKADKSYLTWLSNSDLNEKAKSIISQTLKA